MLRALLIAFVLLGTARAPLVAQETLWPGPGDRVRVSSPRLSGEFLVVESGTEVLIVRESAGGSNAPLSVDTVDELEIYRGNGSTGFRALGIVLGAGVGTFVGAGVGSASSDGLDSLETAETGAYIGAVVGAVFGFLMASRERWEPVPLPARVVGVRLDF